VRWCCLLSSVLMVAACGSMLMVAACGGAELPPKATGTKVAPESDAERQMLALLDGMQSGEVKTVGGVEVRAEPSYAAASGTTCRWLAVTSSGVETRRLACKDGPAWFYAPNERARRAGRRLRWGDGEAESRGRVRKQSEEAE